MSDNVVKLLSWLFWGLTPFFLILAVLIYTNFTDTDGGSRNTAEALLGYWTFMAAPMLLAFVYDIKTVASGDEEPKLRAAQGLRAVLIVASMATVYLGVTYSPFA